MTVFLIVAGALAFQVALAAAAGTWLRRHPPQPRDRA